MLGQQYGLGEKLSHYLHNSGDEDLKEIMKNATPEESKTQTPTVDLSSQGGTGKEEVSKITTVNNNNTIIINHNGTKESFDETKKVVLEASSQFKGSDYD